MSSSASRSVHVGQHLLTWSNVNIFKTKKTLSEKQTYTTHCLLSAQFPDFIAENTKMAIYLSLCFL